MLIEMNHWDYKDTEQYLINKRHGSQMLIKTASRPNHTSYRKFYTNEFVQNSLCCNVGIIIFDL